MHDWQSSRNTERHPAASSRPDLKPSVQLRYLNFHHYEETVERWLQKSVVLPRVLLDVHVPMCHFFRCFSRWQLFLSKFANLVSSSVMPQHWSRTLRHFSSSPPQAAVQLCVAWFFLERCGFLLQSQVGKKSSKLSTDVFLLPDPALGLLACHSPHCLQSKTTPANC